MEEKEMFDEYLKNMFDIDSIDTFPEELKEENFEFPKLEDE